MSLFSKLFGGGAKPGPESVEYKGFSITPTPIKEPSGHRISARIEKTVGGEAKSHTLIRADILQDPEAAAEASVGKARQLIDERGDALFG